MMDPKTDSETIRNEVEASERTILAASVDEKSSKLLAEPRRLRLIEGISRIMEDVEEKVRREEHDSNIFLVPKATVEVCFFPYGAGLAGYGVHRLFELSRYDNSLLRKKPSRAWNLKMRRKARCFEADMMRKKRVWYAELRRFQRSVETLKQEILEGKHDEKLGTEPARVIYDFVTDRANSCKRNTTASSSESSNIVLPYRPVGSSGSQQG
jgi:hypothetical protein